jgi:hypothetical protein
MVSVIVLGRAVMVMMSVVVVVMMLGECGR